MQKTGPAARIGPGRVHRLREQLALGTSPARAAAFGGLLAALIGVFAVLFVIRHHPARWSTVGAPSTVASAPAGSAIALLAVRRGPDVTVVGLARGRRRCLPIQFSLSRVPGRSAGVGGVCLPGRLVGSAVRVRLRAAAMLRVYAAGTLLAEVRPDDLDGCSGGRDVCAMAFDRHALRLELVSRERDEGEVDRDDGVVAMLHGDGAPTTASGRPAPRAVRFGGQEAQLWNVALEPLATGETPPTTQALVDGLLTRAAPAPAVRLIAERPRGSRRSLVPGAAGVFVD